MRAKREVRAGGLRVHNAQTTVVTALKPRGMAGSDVIFPFHGVQNGEKCSLFPDGPLRLRRGQRGINTVGGKKWIGRTKGGTKNGRLDNSRGACPHTAGSVSTSSLPPQPSPILVATLLSSLSSSTSWRTSTAIVSENTRMSFTATPLDQNRRVNRNTFFNKQAQNQQSRVIPTSYPYG